MGTGSVAWGVGTPAVERKTTKKALIRLYGNEKYTKHLGHAKERATNFCLGSLRESSQRSLS